MVAMEAAELMERTRGENMIARQSSSQLTEAENTIALQLKLIDALKDLADNNAVSDDAMSEVSHSSPAVDNGTSDDDSFTSDDSSDSGNVEAAVENTELNAAEAVVEHTGEGVTDADERPIAGVQNLHWGDLI